MNGRLEYFEEGGIKHILEFDGTEALWIGRRSECAIHNLDENLSREHCWIERERPGGDFVIQDNASRAGTYVNGQSVDTHILAPGDMIQCASLTIYFFVAVEGDADAKATEALNTRIAELQQQVVQARGEIEAAKEARKSAEDDAIRWREEERKLNAQLDRLEARLRSRDEQRSAEVDASSQVRSVIPEYEAKIHKAEQRAQELEEELEEVRGKLSKQKSKLDKQKLELTKLRKEIDGFAGERDDLWVKLKAEKENSESMNDIVERQEKMISDLRAAAIERDKLIQELRTSG